MGGLCFGLMVSGLWGVSVPGLTPGRTERSPLAGLFGVPFGTCGQFVGLRPLVWKVAPCGALWCAFRHLWAVCGLAPSGMEGRPLRGFLVCLSALVGSLWACAQWFGRTPLAGLFGVPFGTCGSFGGLAPTGSEGRPLRGFLVCLSALVGQFVGLRPLKEGRPWFLSALVGRAQCSVVLEGGPLRGFWCAFRHLCSVCGLAPTGSEGRPLRGFLVCLSALVGSLAGLRPLVWKDAPCGAFWCAFRHLWAVCGLAPTGLEGRPLRGFLVCLSALVGSLAGLRPLVSQGGRKTPCGAFSGVPFGTCGS